MSDEKRDLAADLAMCEAATPAPWYRLDTNIGADAYHANTDVRGNPVIWHGKQVGSTPVCRLVSGFVHFEGDCDFIPAAREGWPHTIRRAIAAEAEVERLKGIIEGLAERVAQQAELLSRRA